MKKDLLTFLFCVFIIPGLAQITVESDDIISAGKVAVLGVDTTSNFSPGNGGENQTWDFSSVLTQEYDTMWFMLPDQTPYPDAFPEANLALRIFLEGAFMYLSHTAQEISALGGMVSFPELPGMELRAPIIPKQVIAAFPMNYLDNYTQSFVQEIKVANTIPALTLFPNPTSDKVTVRFRIPDTRCQVGIFTIDGRKVWESKIESTTPGVYELDIDVRWLPAGLYFVKTQDGNQSETQKLVICD